jgi:hypothetical protein
MSHITNTEKWALKKEKIVRLLENGSLSGYIIGVDRKSYRETLVSHIYKGSFENPEYGLCKWSMDKYGGFSIFRNIVGKKGICKLCLKKLLIK